MSIDSTANLLFTINADSADAEGNIARFRSLLSKDLSEMSSELGDWSNKVFGSLTSLQGLMTAGAATLAAAIVGVAGAAIEMAGKYEEYVSEVNEGTKKTGIAAEQMSALKFAANATGTEYGSLVSGLTKFEATVVKAAAGSQQQADAFARMGITQAQLAAGEKNVIPLLETVMDRFKGLASGTERAAMARDLFGRGGAEMLGFLRLGSEGLRQMSEEAERLGLIITQKDIEAMKEHKAATREMKEEAEAFAVAVGREVLPILEAFTVVMIGLVETVKDGGLTSGRFFAMWIANAELAQERIQRLVQTMGAMGDQELKPAPEKIAAAKEPWYGFTQVLDQVRSKFASTQGEEAQLAQEFSHLTNELQKTEAEYQKLVSEGKLSADAAAREGARRIEIVTAIQDLETAQLKQFTDKKKAAEQAAHDDLVARVDAQEEQTVEVRERHWNEEIDKLRDKYVKEKNLTAANEALIEQLRTTGLARMRREQVDSYQAELEQLQQFLATVVTSQMTSAQRMGYQYDADLAKFSAAEEQKVLVLARSEGERAAISAQFEMNRQAALQRYGNDMIALQNSQGWSGVFGSRFAQLLAHDEAALKEWQQSADQAFNLVSQSGAAFDGLMQKAFTNFADGMASGIAHAVIYSQSIGQAMRAAAAATMESIASESLVQAIYATAIGFIRLAQHDYPAATAAFTAAAEFGAVAGVAMAVGRAIAPSQAAAGSTAAASSGAAGSTAAAGSASSGSGQQVPGVTIVVQGNVYRNLDPLIDALNDAVLNRNKALYATATTTGGVVYR